MLRLMAKPARIVWHKAEKDMCQRGVLGRGWDDLAKGVGCGFGSLGASGGGGVEAWRVWW